MEQPARKKTKNQKKDGSSRKVETMEEIAWECLGRPMEKAAFFPKRQMKPERSCIKIYGLWNCKEKKNGF